MVVEAAPYLTSWKFQVVQQESSPNTYLSFLTPQVQESQCSEALVHQWRQYQSSFSSDAISTDKLDFLSWHKIVNGGRGSSISHVMEASGCPTKARAQAMSTAPHTCNKSFPASLRDPLSYNALLLIQNSGS